MVCRSSSRWHAPLGSDRCWHRSAASYRLYPELPDPSRCPGGSFDKRTLAPPCCDTVQTRLTDQQVTHTASLPRAPQTHRARHRCGNVCQCWLHLLHRRSQRSCWHQPPWEGCRFGSFSLRGHSAGRSHRSPPGRRCPSPPRPCPSR